MKNKQSQILEKFTLGDTPAAIYLVDALNNSTNPMDRSVLKLISDFKSIFNQLVKAYENEHITARVMSNFIENKKIALKIQIQNFISLGYTPLVVNLYSNMINADMKQFNRKRSKISVIERSAQDRAKSILKKCKQSYANQNLQTYGKSGDELVSVEVQFNQHGLPQVKIDKDSIKDDITSESLMNKSIARLTRLGKIPYSQVKS